MLDEDGLTWAGTVARAWRRVADAVVAVVGAFVLASLTVRRLHEMATAEIAGIGLVLVLGAARLALG
jgi:hypothetical protein